ncbi:MAG: ATP-binding protein, partial [Nitrospira sp.]|nr:ATP-binding protein [Nitrospira sp.]
MAEVVANSWDADAENVKIAIGKSDGKIIITDDGHGMDLADINSKFLNVGYRRRDEDPVAGRITLKWKRPVMGRKGIGKLSLFSIARHIDVFSIKGCDKQAFTMDIEAIKSHISKKENEYSPPPIPHAQFPTDLSKGTRIVLSQPKKRLHRTAESLRVRLARRFSVLGADHHFQVSINDSPVSIEDRGYFPRLQYIWHFGEAGKRAADLSKNLEEKEERASEIIVAWDDGSTTKHNLQGWVGTVRDSGDLKDDEENLNKIVVMVRGKLAQEDILEEFNEGRLFTKYLIGEIHADFLDLDDKDDSATSSRQKIIEDDPRYLALKEFIRAEVRNI